MTADPHIDRAVRIAKAIREESSDPVTFPLWKPWAMDMADGIDALAARLEAAERDLRREWWLNHGHDISSLYGDDGEMQCGKCLADFKRDPIHHLRDVVHTARIDRAAQQPPSSAVPDLSKAIAVAMIYHDMPGAMEFMASLKAAAQQPPAEETA